MSPIVKSFEYNLDTFSDTDLIGYYVFLRLVPANLLPSNVYQEVLRQFTNRRIDSSIIPLADPTTIKASSTDVQRATYKFKLQFFQEFYANEGAHAEMLKAMTAQHKLAKRDVPKYEKKVIRIQKALEKAKQNTIDKQLILAEYITKQQDAIDKQTASALKRKSTLETQIQTLHEKEFQKSTELEETRQLLLAARSHLEQAEAVLFPETVDEKTLEAEVSLADTTTDAPPALASVTKTL